MGYSTPPERDTLQIMYTNVSESPLVCIISNFRREEGREKDIKRAMLYLHNTQGYLITVTNMEDGTGQMHNNETTLLKSEHDWFPKAAASRTGEPTWSSVSKGNKNNIKNLQKRNLI